MSWNGVPCLTLECFRRAVVGAVGMELPLLQGAMSSVIIRSISSKDKWASLSQLFWIKASEHTACEICQSYQVEE